MFSYRNIVVFKLITLIYFNSAFLGFGQSINNINFISWQKENGLPSNLINVIEQDKFGFLWVGTNDGLCRLDGPDSFKIFKKEEDNEKSTNSLKSNFIRSLCSDSEGNLWIGTKYGGLTKFYQPSKSWKTYEYISEENYTLNHNDVLSIFEDSKKRIWVGTEEGLSFYDQTNDQFIEFIPDSINTKPQIPGGILTIMEDQNNWLWLGTWANGLYLLLKDENGNYNSENFRHFETTSNRVANNVWTMEQDKLGHYYLGTHGGGVLVMELPENASNKVEQQNWSPHFDTYKFSFRDSKNMGFNLVQALHQDKNNNDLWIGTAQGIFKIDSKHITTQNLLNKTLLSKYDVFIPSDDNLTLESENVNYILEDKQGLFWLATSEGISQFNKYTNQFKSTTFSNKYTRLSFTPCIAVDAAKNIWISSTAEGLSKYKINDKKLEKIEDLNHLLIGDRASTIKLIKDRLMYVADDAGISKIDLHTEYANQYPYPKWVKKIIGEGFVYNIMIDRIGFIWFGTYAGLFRINSKTKEFKIYLPDKTNTKTISDKAINSIVEDSKGNVWIATWYGLNKIENIETDSLQFESFFYDNNHQEAGPNSNAVLCLKEVDGYLYIGTDRGLCGYNYTTGKFEDLASPGKNYSTRSIEEGTNKDIWVSINEGVINFNKEKNAYQLFDKKDGLGSTTYRFGASFKDAYDNIYFASVNGITYFSPNNLSYNNVPPPVYITDIEISNGDENRYLNGLHQKDIELEYADYRISIKYASQNFNRPDKNKYMYRMPGIEDDWIDIKFGIPITFTSLPTNKYQLEVKAANNDGIWNNKPAILNITKHPPYWQTWWFRLLIALLIALLVFFLFKLYTQNIRKNNERLKGYNEKLKEYNENLNTEITNRKKIEQKLQINNDELKRSNNDLEQFAYITAHDLKEPVHLITSFSGLLSQKYGNKFEGDASKFIDIIVGGTKRMGRLVDDLLTYSIVGNKDSVYSKINLNQLIEEKLSDLSLLIEEKNAEIIVKNLPEITGDEEQVGMVFTNLINNGLKFNISEIPTITIQSEEIEEYWKFSIKDNGIGIEPEYQEQIFGIFKRLHNRNKYDGTGIGLSVCQKIILRHEGKIWLESKLGEGTIFFFTIKKELLPAKQHHHPELL